MNRKGPWEGYRRQAKRRLARCLLPAFLCAHIFIERKTSGYEAGQIYSRGAQCITTATSMRVFEGKTLDYRVFSYDITAAILVSQNNETAAMLVSQTSPVGFEFFSYANAFFYSNKFA